MARPVWHCALRAAPQDRLLSDEEWAQVAADVMDRTGLSAAGQEDNGVRWVAVRHGADHVHLVAVLAHQDGRKPRLDFQRYRVREAGRAAEQRYGLRSTAWGPHRRPTAQPGRQHPPGRRLPACLLPAARSRASRHADTHRGRPGPPRLPRRAGPGHARPARRRAAAPAAAGLAAATSATQTTAVAGPLTTTLSPGITAPARIT